MCEYCHKHGEGEKWYLHAKNYSDDLQNELRKHQVFDMKVLHKDMERWEKLRRAPYLVRAIREPRIAQRVRNMHFGQVLPIEDVEKVFGMVNSVVRLECVCRKGKGVKEQRYCYGVSLLPQEEHLQRLSKLFSNGPETSSLERMDKAVALDQFRGYEKEGLCHSIWTELTPFVLGICNCDRSDCGAMQEAVVKGLPTMFRSEYVAELNPELCNGCRACMRVCQFGAIGYSVGNKRAFIDIRRCYGCGVCRASCTKGAIHLHDRSSVPAVANVW